MRVRAFAGTAEVKTAAAARAVALARTTIGDDEVLVEVLTGPNAIGVCQVRHLTDTLSRFHARLKPHNDAARELLGRADRFVQRDARTADNPKAPDEPLIEGWPLDDVELLRCLLASEVAENQRLSSATFGRRKQTFVAICQQKIRALRYVKDWLKQERIRRTADAAGLTELWRLTGENQSDADNMLVAAIRDYLVHFAKTKREDMPDL